MTFRRGFALFLVITCTCSLGAHGEEPRSRGTTQNVVLVTTDGLRWQEVFRGAEESLLNKKDGGVEDVDALRREFWRATPEARREALMPFLWKVVGRQGQLFGNADKGSHARVTNGRNFSYPGYNELLTGSADRRIDSNDKVPNANVSVLEWLNRKEAYRGKVAAIGSWDVFPYILNRERSGLKINAGWQPIAGDSLTESEILTNRLMAQDPRLWEDCRHDSFTAQVVLEHLKRNATRVLYISFGDTDEFAHSGRYDHYLRAARRVDANLEILWNELQSRPEFRGTTTLIVSTDHGRGDPPRGWRDHGEKTKGSDAIWIAALGPDTPALGERSNTQALTQGQVAATVASLLGEDYLADAPKAAKPIADVIKPTGRQALARPLSRIAFGSCATQERPQPIWKSIVAARPELFLFLGDNIYADTEDMGVMRAKYAKLAAMPGFKVLRERCPILATWDDHDLGVNDGGSDYPMKDASQKIFLDFFGEASNSPRRKRPGVYDAHVYGPEGQRVQVIMLDTRYFRTSLKKKPSVQKNIGPYQENTDPAATVLGEDQWRWLEAQLRIPAEVRVIASSIQVVAEDHDWEKWKNFPRERERLFNLIRDTRAEGVVLLSGDRHLAELSMMEAGLGYPVFDLTSSGLNQASKSWRAFETNRHRVSTMNWGDNFGFIAIDWERPDPTISLQIRDVDGEITIQQKLNLSALKRKVSKGRKAK